MPEKKRIQTRIVSASAVKRVLDLHSVCLATHLKMFRQKRNTHKLLSSNHSYYRNVAKHLWREPQIFTFENSFHIWINIGYICECTISAMSRVKYHFRTCLTDCNLQSQLHCTVTHFKQNFNWFPTASGVLLLGSRIVFLNKCNRLDIIIFRL